MLKGFSVQQVLGAAGPANSVLFLDANGAPKGVAGLTFDGTNFSTTGTATATKLVPTGNVTAGNGMYLPAANTLAWSTNGAEGLRLDASRNLGLGTTPTTGWRSGARAFQSGANKYVSLWEQANGSSNLGFAVYESASNTFAYTTTGDTPTLYSQLSGAHRWYTAPPGTAGDPITFVQALALDANRNLALNTASVGTNAVGALSIGSGTEPSSGPSDTVQFYSVDRSAGNTIPAFYCEGSGVTNAGITSTTVTNKIAMKINGTVYYLLATTNAT